MSRDTLIVVGVLLITLTVLGSAYMAVSRGVAPSLLGGGSQGSSKPSSSGEVHATSPSSSGPSSGMITTNTEAGKTATQKAPFGFSDIFLKKKEFSITYDYYQDGSMEGNGALYVKGIEKRRMDLKFAQGHVVLIYKGNSTIFCFERAQTGWMCYQSTSKAEIEKKTGGESAKDPVEEGQEKFKSPIYNGTRTYAGEKCYCYYVVGEGKEIVNGVEKAGTQFVEICVTQDGIPTYYMYLWRSSDRRNEIRTDIIAKTISYTVLDDVFNPPAEPTSLP